MLMNMLRFVWGLTTVTWQEKKHHRVWLRRGNVWVSHAYAVVHHGCNTHL